MNNFQGYILISLVNTCLYHYCDTHARPFSAVYFSLMAMVWGAIAIGSFIIMLRTTEHADEVDPGPDTKFKMSSEQIDRLKKLVPEKLRDEVCTKEFIDGAEELMDESYCRGLVGKMA